LDKLPPHSAFEALMSTFVILAATAVCGQGLATPDPVDLERRAVEARLAIHTLHVKLTIEREWYNWPKGSDKGGKLMHYEIWQDATHYRADIFTERSSSTQDLANGRRWVLCQNCEKPGHTIQYFERSGVALIRPDNPLARNLFKGGEAFDPRLLGCTTDNHLNMRRPGTAQTLPPEFNSPERSPATVEAAHVDGEAAWVLKNKVIRGGANIRVYFLSGKGGAIGLIESTGKTDKYTFRGRFHSELEQEPRTGIWFPKKFVRETFENDALGDRDVVTVHLREFNQPIDPAVFTLAGIDVQNGELVLDAELNRTGKDRPLMQYRDGQIVPYKPDPSAQPVTMTQPRPVDQSVVPGRNRWWYAAAAALFTVAAALLLFRAARRKTAA
jgi:hypothetical protein